MSEASMIDQVVNAVVDTRNMYRLKFLHVMCI